MQQTATEWLIEQLQAPCRGIPSHIIEQANKMFEQQMCQFAFDFNDEFINNGKVPTPEQYYNETFKTVRWD
jgi:hypothetical protein